MFNFFPKLRLMLLALLLALLAQPIQVSRAAPKSTITVTDTSGDTGGPGCKLRDAITAASTDTATGGCPAGSGDDTIVLPTNATITLTVVDNGTGSGVNGLPVITSNFTISGNGTTIQRDSASGTPSFRIFNVSSSGSLTLNDITISGGKAADDFSGTGAGGAGIRNSGMLALSNVTITGNSSGNGINGGSGGAILNNSNATASITRCTINGNSTGYGTGTASSNSGGHGGAIYNGSYATVTITASTINGNSTGNGGYRGGSGGGIYNATNGTATITGSTISGNVTSNGTNYGGGGGGISNNGTITIADSTISSNTTGDGSSGNGVGGGIANIGMLVVTGSAITNNTAGTPSGSDGNGGGGIYNLNGGNATITNSTISSNNTSKGSGGGIANSGTLTVTNSTITGNTTNGQGGGVYYSTGTGALKNTIVANNTSPWGNCYAATTTITNGGNNIEDGTTCGFGSTNGSMSSTNPQLGTLTGNPAYYPLNYNSPAIDGVTYNAPNGCPATDERGQTRDDLACDIGAYEKKMTDSNNATLSPSSTQLTTYGPARAGIQYTGTNPGATTVTKVTNWIVQPANAIGAWWEISPTTGSGLNLTLELCYSTTELRGLTEGDLLFWRYSSNAWSQVGGAPTLSGTSPNRCAQITGVTDLSRWTLATGNPGNSPTAVTLSSFSANAPTFDLAAWFVEILRQWRR